jgi:type IV pilus assembly protein PilW
MNTRHHAQRMHGNAGTGMTELMVALAIGMFISLCAITLLLSSKTTYQVQDEAARMQENGRYALQLVARALRQASHENWDVEAGAVLNDPRATPNLSGWDARSLSERTEGIEKPLSKAVNGSDVLAVRYIGSGTPPDGDGTILNCAGFSVGLPQSVEEGRGWSIFYVALDAMGEPELRCKYRGKSAWNSEALIRGVEAFQVLYGLDTDADGAPNRFVRASELIQLDTSLPLRGVNAVERLAEANQQSHWKKVVSVQIAMLIRGAQGTRADDEPMLHDLFGKTYGELFGAVDAGTRIPEAEMNPALRTRLRRIFATTVRMRNLETGVTP